MKVELSKDVPEDAFVFTAIASKEVEDDDGEIISLKGMDFSRFKKNPTIKRDHSINADDSVGSAIELEVRGNELWVKAFISSTEEKLIKKVKEGVIRDLSIGFLPVEVENNVITKSILYEITLTGLGCNGEAKIVEKNKSSKLSLKTFTIKNMDEKKKETTEKVVEKKETFSKEEVNAIAEKSAEVAVKKALETSKKIEKESQIEKDKKDFKQERSEKSNSILSVKKDFKNLDKKEMKKEFFTKMFDYNRTGSKESLLSLKAMTEGVDAQGGYTVPEPLHKELFVEVMRKSHLLKLVHQVTMTSKTLEMPLLQSDEPDPLPVAEYTASAEADMTIETNIATAYKLAVHTIFSDELLEDSNYDLIKYCIAILNRRAAIKLDKEILNGGGSATKEMDGILQDATIVAGAIDMTGATDFDEIRNGIDDMPLEYLEVEDDQDSLDSRKNYLGWVIPQSAKKWLRTLKDGNNNYYWQTAVTAGAPDMLDGYPVKVVPNSFMPANTMLFGNFGQGYVVGIRSGGKVRQSMEYKFLEDAQTIKFSMRKAGMVLATDAFQMFSNVPTV